MAIKKIRKRKTLNDKNKAKEKGKKLKIRSNEKYQRDMKVAIRGEERKKHKVCKAYSQTNSGGLGLLSTQDIAK